MPDTPPHAADLAPDMAPDLPPSDLPMSGIRVLDCATFIAAPYTAAILGEFGAEVIKVEQPGEGDPFRKFGTPAAQAISLVGGSEGFRLFTAPSWISAAPLARV